MYDLQLIQSLSLTLILRVTKYNNLTINSTTVNVFGFCIPGKDQVHESFIFNEWVFIFLVFIHVVQRFAGIKILQLVENNKKRPPSYLSTPYLLRCNTDYKEQTLNIEI